MLTTLKGLSHCVRFRAYIARGDRCCSLEEFALCAYSLRAFLSPSWRRRDSPALSQSSLLSLYILSPPRALFTLKARVRWVARHSLDTNLMIHMLIMRARDTMSGAWGAPAGTMAMVVLTGASGLRMAGAPPFSPGAMGWPCRSPFPHGVF